MTRVLITGVNGQDGSYLAETLLAATTDEVWGSLRTPDHPRRWWITAAAPNLHLTYLDLLDRDSVEQALNWAIPDVIYHLAAMASPGQAWTQPELCGQVTGLGTLRLLQAAHRIVPRARIVVAGSLATHGPYGAAKTYARAIAEDYRAQGMHVSVAVMCGHHSPRRAPSYLAAKVARHAAARSRGEPVGLLHLGRLNRVQDWGWAPDFIHGLIEIAEDQPAGTYTLATGDPRPVNEYVADCFATVGLDWRDETVLDLDAGNLTDVPSVSASPDGRLGWRPTVGFEEIVRRMVEGA